ncbi:hypothetical protein [Spongiactinospora sp. 9N601]|uniref:hypothetical protein n=1 Tax=Spongiactinospora sp. 9N601 TaxID=3375149 RepID=UPI00378D482C
MGVVAAETLLQTTADHAKSDPTTSSPSTGVYRQQAIDALNQRVDDTPNTRNSKQEEALKRITAGICLIIGLVMSTVLPAAANVPANRIIEIGQYSVTSEARYYAAGETVVLTLVPYGDSRNTLSGDLLFCTTNSGCNEAIWTDFVKTNHDNAQKRFEAGRKGYFSFRLRCTGGGEPTTTCHGRGTIDDVG